MDELPPDAKALLALARKADEPPAAARERVRGAVALTLSAGVALSAAKAAATAGARGAALKAGFLSTLPGKLALVSGAVMVIGAGALLVPQAAEPPQHSALPAAASAPKAALPATSQPPAQAPAPAEQLAVQEHEPAQQHARAVQARPRKDEPAGETLGAEMKLLKDATAALDRGELATARALLKSHRTQYQPGLLSEERRGLEVLAGCLARESNSERNALTYLRSAPKAVLAGRIVRTCAAEDAP